MKKLIGLSLIAMVFILSACSFSKGVKKDLSTGLSYNYNGFGVENVLLVDPNNEAMHNNKVQLNTVTNMIVVGLTNYGLKDGKVFPGMKIVVTDKNGNAVINQADLFSDTPGYPAESASQLRGSITVAQPMKSGETYHVKMRVWDKVEPANELNTEVDLVVL